MAIALQGKVKVIHLYKEMKSFVRANLFQLFKPQYISMYFNDFYLSPNNSLFIEFYQLKHT